MIKYMSLPMRKYKAIVSDIDGTLTPLIPNSLPSKRVKESIKMQLAEE
jgi:hypothetical protein